MQAKQPRSDILYMTTLDTGRCSHEVCLLIVLLFWGSGWRPSRFRNRQTVPKAPCGPKVYTWAHEGVSVSSLLGPGASHRGTWGLLARNPQGPRNHDFWNSAFQGP